MSEKNREMMLAGESNSLSENLDLKEQRDNILIDKIQNIDKNLDLVLDARKKLAGNELLTNVEIDALNMDSNVTSAYKEVVSLVESTGSEQDNIRIEKIIQQQNRALKEELANIETQDIHAKIDALSEAHFGYFENIVSNYLPNVSKTKIKDYLISLFVEEYDTSDHDTFNFKGTAMLMHEEQVFEETKSVSGFLKYAYKEGVPYDVIEKNFEEAIPVIEDVVKKITSGQDFYF